MRFLKQKNISQYSAADDALMIYDNRDLASHTQNGGRAVMDITGALRLPKGTTNQRPKLSGVRTPNGPNGYIRYNTTTNSIEGYIDSAWEVIRAPGASAIQVSRFAANGTETTFGPLNSAYVSSYSVSDYNVMVLVDNVIQIGARVNYKLVQYNGSIFVTTGSSGAVYSTSGPGSYTSGEYYIQFPSAVPALSGTGDPIYVTVFYGYGN